MKDSEKYAKEVSEKMSNFGITSGFDNRECESCRRLMSEALWQPGNSTVVAIHAIVDKGVHFHRM